MPNPAYEEGYSVGTVGAHLDAVAVKAAKNTAGLYKLAGLRLTINKRQHPENWWIQSSNSKYEEGFFDGYINRAEAIRSAGG